jgi:diguanylate cyclase (GGDEF)-like protein
MTRASPTFIWCATAVGLVVNLLFFVAVAHDFYRTTLALNVQSAKNVATLVENDVARNIELFNLSLQSVLEGIKDPEVMSLPARLRQLALFDRSATAPGLGALVVLNKEGTIIVDSLGPQVRRGNFADREYFKVHQNTPQDLGLYVSRPFQARLQGNDWSISISRRITNSDGSFGGIVSGILKLDYFKNQFKEVILGARGIITLFRDDGILLIRTLGEDNFIGEDLRTAPVFKYLSHEPSGSFQNIGLVDGIPRLYAYQRVANLPLVVQVSLSEADVLAPWWSKVKVLAIVFALMATSILILVTVFISELRRRERAERAAAALARKDALTQLVNRLGFEEAFEREWKRGARDGRPLSLILIDIDHFKRFNDTYGHPEGDRVLAMISKVVDQTAQRPSDVAARYGGEEIAVLLPDTDERGAAQIAHMIRQKVADLMVPHVKSEHQIVTISLGVTTMIPSLKLPAAQLVENADIALYSAKAQGRNGACMSNVVSPSLDGRRMRA